LNNTVLAALATLSVGTAHLTTPSIAVAESADPSAAELHAVTQERLNAVPVAQAELGAVTEDTSDAVMGPAQDYQRGLTVDGVAPTLRSVVVDGESILAYCIEYWVQAADPDHESAVTTWEEFTGDNNFKTDSQVREQVAWILRHSYPTVSLAEVAQRTGAKDLTAPEVISATQAAIWHFTDDIAPDGNLVIEDGPTVSMTEHSADNIQAIFDYLTGANNTGLSEQAVQASVTLEDASDPTATIPAPVAEATDLDRDHIFGPILLNASTSEVELTVQSTDTGAAEERLNILNNDGEPVDLKEPITAEEIWVHVPAEVPTGGVRLMAESTEYGYTGRLIIPEPDGQRRFQTIVVVDQATDTATTELELAWEQLETPEPEPSEEVSAAAAEEPEPQIEQTPSESSSPKEQPSAEVISEEPRVEDTTAPTPEPEASESSTAIDEASEQATPEAAEPAQELAKTGAQQLRNVLLGLGVLAVGAGLVTFNRLKRAKM